jgi:hypothetical protein
MHGTVWGLVEMECWLVQHQIVAVELFIKTESIAAMQHGFDYSFKDVIHLAAVLYYCGYENGIRKDQ